jgi:hypothetical protein
MTKVDCKKGWNRFLVAVFPGWFVCKVTPTPDPVPSPTPGPEPLGIIRDPPQRILGGEVVRPFGKDIRFLVNDRLANGSKLSNGKFCGNWAAPMLQRSGTSYTFFDHTEDGMLYHVEGWSYPGSKDTMRPGNTVTWDDNGTLRLYLTARK